MIYRIKKQYYGVVLTEDDFTKPEIIQQVNSLEGVRFYYAVQVRGLLFWHTVKVFETIRAAAEFLHELQTIRNHEI